MSLSRVAIRRPVAVAMFFLAVATFGVISFTRLPIDLLPAIPYPHLVVHTSYPNVASAEVERLVTERIEEAVSAVPGVLRIESISREGLSLVTVRFAWGTDMDFAALNVRERLDNLRTRLPSQSRRPVVVRTDPHAQPIMTISLSGNRNLWILSELAESVFRRRLEQLDGVAQAAVTGGLEREINIDVDPGLLDAYGIDLDEVTRALHAANASAPGGSVRRGTYRYALRALGDFQSPSEIETVVINPVGVTLRDIARVNDGFRERESLARHNGRDAIGLLIFKESGANTVRVAKRVEEVLTQLRRDYPDLSVEIASSQAVFVSAAIRNIVQQVLFGGAMAFLVLFLFLRDVRYPLAIALAIPISILAAFALFDAFGIGLNVMTLGGLALSVGLLMDNSVIVIENIFRRREMGAGAVESAASGTEEVQRPIFAATLTTIAVFGPIIYTEGLAGRLFGAVSFAVAFSLATSIVVAITLLPALAARWSGGPRGRHSRAAPASGQASRASTFLSPVWRTAARPIESFDRAFASFAEGYERALKWSLNNRGRVAGITVALLLLAALIAARLPRSVLPKVDEGAFLVRILLPLGTPLEAMAALSARVEQVALADSGVEAVFSRVGRSQFAYGVEDRESGSNAALLDVRLDGSERTPQVLQRLRQSLPELPEGVVTFETGQSTAIGRLLEGDESDLVVLIQGSEPEVMQIHARAVESRLKRVGSVTNVRRAETEGQPEISVEIDRERAARYGIASVDIARAIESSMRGVVATEYTAFDRRIPVIVRLPEEARYSLRTLRELRVHGIPLRELVSTRETAGPGQIRRIDQRRVQLVHADIAAGGLDAALADVSNALRDLPTPAGVRVDIVGANEEMRNAFRSLAFALALAVLLVFMILAAQFESVRLPLIILVSLPLGTIGAIAALWITGNGLNAVSIIGIIVLAGIVDNDAVVKVDLINRIRGEGIAVREAIVMAGRARLRPIIINSITTMLGVLPMALAFGRGGELQAPIAIAIFGGLFTSTLLTLVVIPVVYDLVEQPRVRGADEPAANAPHRAGARSLEPTSPHADAAG